MMVVFRYDKTFEGLLSAVFEAYSLKTFPDILVGENETLPLFYDEEITIGTDKVKSERVWKGLEKKLSRASLTFITWTWLSEAVSVDMLLFRYIRKMLDASSSAEMNFGDPDVLAVSQWWKKVSHERHRIIQFARFQKTCDGVYFAPLSPLYNVLPLAVNHFKDRFADQKWLIYDLKRKYGYYYDLHQLTDVYFEKEPPYLVSGKLDGTMLAEDEKLFQHLWKEYFRSLTIQERINPKLHRQNLPARFWKYLTEKQS